MSIGVKYIFDFTNSSYYNSYYMFYEGDIMNREFINGLKNGVPICLGYFPIAMTFGILSKGTNLTLLQTLGFSFIVFAGAAQFIAVSMIAIGSSGLEILITTFFLNFRHFLMSASLARKIKFSNNIYKPIVSFFVTDESFSVASFLDTELTDKRMLGIQLISYFGWGIGTGVGYLVGSILPPLLQESMGIGLYAMFIALLTPEIKKTPKALILAILSGVINTIFIYYFNFNEGWGIVASIVLVSIIGTLIFKEDNQKVLEELINE